MPPDRMRTAHIRGLRPCCTPPGHIARQRLIAPAIRECRAAVATRPPGEALVLAAEFEPVIFRVIEDHESAVVLRPSVGDEEVLAA